MALYLPNDAKIEWLKIFVNTEVFYLHQYQTSLAPDRDTTLDDLLLIECDYDGYDSAGALVSGWSDPVIDGLTNRATSTATALVFTCEGDGAPNQVYGYWIDNNAGELIAVEEFPSGPVPMTMAGEGFSLTPVLTQMSQFNN